MSTAAVKLIVGDGKMEHIPLFQRFHSAYTHDSHCLFVDWNDNWNDDVNGLHKTDT